MTGEYRALDSKRIHQRDDIRPDRGLLARPQGCEIAKPRRTEPAQIGNDDAAALRHELSRDIDIGMNVVGKAVEQDCGRACRWSRLHNRRY